MERLNFDAIIVGGGASGLMCAASAKQKNKSIKIAIVEKNDRVGKKLLSTGNGRCNLTHENISHEKYVGSFLNGAKSILRLYPTQRILDIFADMGLLACKDSEGRYYPYCKQASAVLDVLRLGCEALGVKIFTGQNIKSIKRQGEYFCCSTDEYSFTAKKLVLANGSKASPKLGGNSSVSDYAKNFGHTFIPFSPALCPLEVKSDLLKSLKGIRASVQAELDDGKIIMRECGEVQFNEKALSGICIFNLSTKAEKGMKIHLNFLRDYSFEEIFSMLKRNRKLFASRSADSLFTGILQKRLAQAVMKLSGFTDFSVCCSKLDDMRLKKIASRCVNAEFEIVGKSSFEQAQTAKGGVCGSEIDENTMQSKRVRGLYFCGEAIDICGECGGYNLHLAFASGHLAGVNL